jgi:ribonuclease G
VVERALDGVDPGGGFILRSAAEGAPDAELIGETQGMLGARAHAESHGPGLACAVETAGLVALREWTHPLPDRLAVPPGTPAQSCAALHARAEGDRDALAGLAEAVDALRSPRVDLPGGAFMTVEPTRALVAVDVNTGGDFSPAAGLKATLAAIRELPRQLRLRGLGGQIVIDPAPVGKKDRRTVEESLKAALKRCPVETSFAGWTPLGMLELNRKRERRPLREVLPEAAP